MKFEERPMKKIVILPVLDALRLRVGAGAPAHN